MKIGLIKTFTYLTISLSCVVTLWIMLQFKPTSIVAFVLVAVWLIAPYILLGVMLRQVGTLSDSIVYFLVTFIVAIGGLLFLTNIIFINLDAQGGIGVLFTPIYQAIAIAVLIPISQRLIEIFTA